MVSELLRDSVYPDGLQISSNKLIQYLGSNETKILVYKTLKTTLFDSLSTHRANKVFLTLNSMLRLGKSIILDTSANYDTSYIVKYLCFKEYKRILPKF